MPHSITMKITHEINGEMRDRYTLMSSNPEEFPSHLREASLNIISEIFRTAQNNGGDFGVYVNGAEILHVPHEQTCEVNYVHGTNQAYHYLLRLFPKS